MINARPAARALIALLLIPLGFGPGCIFGSPVSAISGEPYGMTRDDINAIGGDRRPIWGGHPVVAAIDLPFAAVLDTGFLPISLIMCGILWLASDSEDEGRHRHDADGNDIEEGDEYGGKDRESGGGEPAPHTHRDGTTHAHGDEGSHTHSDGKTHTHGEGSHTHGEGTTHSHQDQR